MSGAAGPPPPGAAVHKKNLAKGSRAGKVVPTKIEKARAAAGCALRGAMDIHVEDPDNGRRPTDFGAPAAGRGDGKKTSRRGKKRRNGANRSGASPEAASQTGTAGGQGRSRMKQRRNMQF